MFLNKPSSRRAIIVSSIVVLVFIGLMLWLDRQLIDDIFIRLIDFSPLLIPLAALYIGVQAASVAERAAVGQREASTRANDTATNKLKLDMFDERFDLLNRFTRLSTLFSAVRTEIGYRLWIKCFNGGAKLARISHEAPVFL